MLIRRVWERNLSVEFRYEVNGRDKLGDEEESEESGEETEEGDEGGDEVEGDPESNNSSSMEIDGVDAEPPKTAAKPRTLLMECGF